MKNEIFILSIFILTLLSCNATNTAESPAKNWWQEIFWDGIEIDGKSPSCSKSPENDTENFSFFIKDGTVNKMLIYFQGGGACWDYNNCELIPKYSMEKQLIDNVIVLDLVSNQNSNAVDAGYGGIFDFTNDKNPFKDWHFIYIPYCTGDLHAGTVDQVYTQDSESVTIQHRGHINFKWVLQWIENNFYIESEPEEIFVTGISAGSYGSIFNYAYIREAFPNSKMFHLGDAGNGVITENFISSGIVNWDITIPAVLGPIDFTTDLVVDFYIAVANHYEDDTFAQYTTAWDDNQTYFYNVMQYIDTPYDEDENVIWDDILSVWCDWNKKLKINLSNTYTGISAYDGSADNYRYYIAPGSVHTILMRPEFYNVTSNGVSLVDWINAMLAEDYTVFKNVECFNDTNDPGCSKPAECPDCL